MSVSEDLPVVVDELAACLVSYQVIDGLDVSSYFISDTIIATDKGYLIDFDLDGTADQEIRPLGLDLTGDGIEDWGLVIVDNCKDTALDKPFSAYTVSEAMLFLVGLVSLLWLVTKFSWRRFRL